MMEQVLRELIEDLNSRQNNRTDIVSEKWVAFLDGRYMKVKIDHGTYSLTKHAHEQISKILEIPKRYYDRLRSADPELLITNINHRHGKSLMFRILDDKIIAVMSDRYLIIDNYDIMMCALDTIKKMHHHGVEILSCEQTDTKMYLKMIQPCNTFDIITNVTVVPGIIVQNSEVGAGALRADMYLVFADGHGMIMDLPISRTHKGKKIDPGVVESDSQDEILAWASTMINLAFDPVHLNHWIAMIRANADKITEKPIETVDRVCEDHWLTEHQKTIILNHFMELGDRTKYALANSVAMTAQETEDLDAAIMLERIAGRIAAEPRVRIPVALT